jgi:hypothetical protein
VWQIWTELQSRDPAGACPPIEAVGDAGRKASFIDPEGNMISFIEVRGLDAS